MSEQNHVSFDDYFCSDDDDDESPSDLEAKVERWNQAYSEIQQEKDAKKRQIEEKQRKAQQKKKEAEERKRLKLDQNRKLYANHNLGKPVIAYKRPREVFKDTYDYSITDDDDEVS